MGACKGFLVFDYRRRATARRASGSPRGGGTDSLRQRLHVLTGLEQAPVGLGMLFRGENHGKLVVRLAEGPTPP